MDTMSFRYDETIRKELCYIQECIQTNQSQAIKEAIHAFYLLLKEKKPKRSPLEAFTNSGYIGSFEGDKNLSTNFKEKITETLKTKHNAK